MSVDVDDIFEIQSNLRISNRACKLLYNHVPEFDWAVPKEQIGIKDQTSGCAEDHIRQRQRLEILAQLKVDRSFIESRGVAPTLKSSI